MSQIFCQSWGRRLFFFLLSYFFIIANVGFAVKLPGFIIKEVEWWVHTYTCPVLVYSGIACKDICKININMYTYMLKPSYINIEWFNPLQIFNLFLFPQSPDSPFSKMSSADQNYSLQLFPNCFSSNERCSSPCLTVACWQEQTFFSMQITNYKYFHTGLIPHPIKLWIKPSVTSTESFIKEVLSAWCHQIQQSISEVHIGDSFGHFFYTLTRLQESIKIS